MKSGGLFLLLAAALAAAAAEPETAVTYRGRVEGDDERTLTGPIKVCLAFHADRGAAATLAFTNDVTPSANGVFSMVAGGAAIERLADEDALNYVGVTAWPGGKAPVGGGEIVPLQRVLPQPYATEAVFADRLAGDGAVTRATADRLLECRTFTAADSAVVTVSNALVAAAGNTADFPLSFKRQWSARKIDFRAPGGVDAFADWRVLGEEWWKADWPELADKDPPQKETLTLKQRGAYFFSSLGQNAGEDGTVSDCTELVRLRRRIWSMPGLAVLAYEDQKIEKATTVFADTFVDTTFGMQFGKPKLTAACLTFRGTEEGDGK